MKSLIVCYEQDKNVPDLTLRELQVLVRKKLRISVDFSDTDFYYLYDSTHDVLDVRDKERREGFIFSGLRGGERNYSFRKPYEEELSKCISRGLRVIRCFRGTDGNRIAMFKWINPDEE